jgi:hypothetical protein
MGIIGVARLFAVADQDDAAGTCRQRLGAVSRRARDEQGKHGIAGSHTFLL